MIKSIQTLFKSMILLICFTQVTIAQDAPDFTHTDIFGNEHNLYSYLDDGKAVLLDFSATWCPPCWSIHQAGTLDNIYHDYGPGGLDEVVVIFIEPDLGTNEACLYGNTIECVGGTQGDWVTGVPYPIIDLQTSTTQSAYGVTAFPTLFVISPDRKIKKTYVGGGFSASEMRSTLINSLIPDAGTSSKVLGMSADSYTCTQNSAYFEMMNRGEDVISELTVEIFGNGTLIETQVLAVDVPSLSFKNITLDPFSMPSDENVLLEIKVTADGDIDPSNDVASVSVSRAIGTDNYINIYIKGDESSGSDNTKYAIYNPAGEKIFEADVNKNEVIESKAYFSDPGCHRFELSEGGFGDGLSFGDVEITSNDGEVIFDNKFFGTKGGADFIADAVSSNQDESLVENQLFPNPTTNELNITISDNMTLPASFTLYNQLGEIIEVRSITEGYSTIQFDVPNGIYSAIILGKNGKRSIDPVLVIK